MPKNNNKKMSGNKGEWTELYVFLKLLAQGKIYAISEKLKKAENIYYPIVKIMRKGHEGEQTDYVIDEDEVVVKTPSGEIMRIRRSEIDRQAKSLFDEIKKGSGLNFKLPEIENFAKSIKVTTMTAPSGATTDIFMRIRDVHTQSSPDLGFSIKSQIGEAATLLNASPATNFIYKVEGLTREQADEINGIGTEEPGFKIAKRMAAIREYGGKLSFVRPENDIFKENLIMTDGNMPEIIADMLLHFYNKSSNDEGMKECKKLVELVGKCDSPGYGDAARCTDKFKKFLCARALGMKPATKWDGFDEVNGGYIIVTRDGEILAYHIYYRNSFEQYLLDNTIFERPSVTKHKYMNLYEENGEMFIKLNLQIRFK